MKKKLINYLKEKPTEYAPSSKKFWDDEHISKFMLKAHLSPDEEGASRKHDFIEKSVEWITSLGENRSNRKLLDLGCGPGIYAEKFYNKGFDVTGIDFSKRSIEYAVDSAAKKNMKIKYKYMNYLEIDYDAEFDIAVLIYCDLGVLSPDDRKIFLKKIYKALKPGGILILDVFIENFYEKFQEKTEITYENSGFWSDEPYSCIQRNSIYRESMVSLEQYIIITENQCECYNIWNHIFNKNSIRKELEMGGFSGFKFFNNVAGEKESKDNSTLCIYAEKI
ncbi:class I SAM-dependent methyltransferase [Fusobacterium sp.]|uniref:class I SAM-dependent methyltransferase n=1 Tax=Fusobacterium sp. TaxID=68766 RepID=UPI002901607C|nr:class I SAM-dependent methyltransferase [Fusobacterium sp.]MDU1910297.1 class I SAM-dependent methyltransferase [Fusobacterium sp.]